MNRNRRLNVKMAGLMTVMLLCTAAIVNIVHASSGSHSINDGLILIERIDERARSTDILLGNAGKAVKEATGSDVTKAEAILKPIAGRSFAPETVMKQVREALGIDTDDGSRLYDIAIRLEQGRTKVDDIVSRKDAVGSAELEKAVRERRQEIEGVADLMAGQDLASETAFLGETLRLALIGNTANDSEFADQPKERLGQLAAVGVQKLHSQGVSQGPFSQDIARQSEKAGTIFALATLSEPDLKVLADFYSSQQGREKAKALIQAYRSISLSAAQTILSEYWLQMSDSKKL